MIQLRLEKETHFGAGHEKPRSPDLHLGVILPVGTPHVKVGDHVEVEAEIFEILGFTFCPGVGWKLPKGFLGSKCGLFSENVHWKKLVNDPSVITGFGDCSEECQEVV